MSKAALSLAARAVAVVGLWRPLVDRTREFWLIVLRHRSLIRELVIRDLKGGHAGHGLGSFWIYAQPLVVVATFMLIFGVVIGSRIAITESFPGDYTGYVLVGVVPWLLTAAALGRAPTVFTANANLVKQVVFPIETLPIASTIACFAMFVPTYVVMIAYKFFVGGLSPIVALLPLVLAMHVLGIVGLMLTLSVVTPFLRDLRELVTIYVAISLYVTPATYLPDWVPAALRPLLYLNPFSYVVWVYQDVLFYGRIDHGFAWLVMPLMAIVLFVIGLFVFRQAKRYLGNVL